MNLFYTSGERRSRGASPQKHVYFRYMSMFVIIFVLVGRWTTTHDATRRDATRPPASFDSQTYIQHINKPRLVSKLICFQTFFELFFTEFQNEGGRKARRPPPPRRRTGLILLYRTSGERPSSEMPLVPGFEWRN
jgi:hypothetical protein